jgi:hypothetical protein
LIFKKPTKNLILKKVFLLINFFALAGFRLLEEKKSNPLLQPMKGEGACLSVTYPASLLVGCEVSDGAKKE